MSNHTWMRTRRNLSAKQVDEDIREIAARRFKGLAEIKREDFSSSTCWTLSFPCTLETEKERGHKYSWSFELWLRGKHQLEWPNQYDGEHDWMWWASNCVMAEELAKRYNGFLSGDDDPREHSKPHPKKYQTFALWVEILCAPRFDGYPKKIGNEKRKLIRRYVPKELQAL